jgi:hypothetical protein
MVCWLFARDALLYLTDYPVIDSPVWEFFLQRGFRVQRCVATASRGHWCVSRRERF